MRHLVFLVNQIMNHDWPFYLHIQQIEYIIES